LGYTTHPEAPAETPGAIEVPEEKHLGMEFSFRVGGMWCPACSWVIEEVLKKTQGILEAQVLFFPTRPESNTILTLSLRKKSWPSSLRRSSVQHSLYP
jgi:cation transport ATPase